MTPASYTLLKLTDAEDMAGGFGLSEMGEARFPTEALEAEDTGLSHQRLRAGARQPFAHRHDDAEEVYVVLRGSGRLKLDEEIIEISELDAIRVAPGVIRNFEAGEQGLEFIAFGPRRKGDGEVIQGWWTD